MNDIPPELLAEVLREVEEEQGCPDKYAVPIEELFGVVSEFGQQSTLRAGVSG